MALPRILIAVPLIVAGAFVPAVGSTAVKAPSGAVGMNHETFKTNEVRIHKGETLTFVNNSRYMHIIGPGRDGTLAAAGGEPLNHRVLMPTNASYTTPSFNVPGTYYTTCSMHPEMTVKIVVTD
ncbi:MAG TPA: plastocyanin/azurin family copper-binding protein [Mycobacteriales bacterium]|nr:plastocyanin/azurin family copper-binding protein [Mycobacteriales bacterium]